MKRFALSIVFLFGLTFAANATGTCLPGAPYLKRDWYWAVASNPGNVWSTGDNAYVATSNGTYVSWVAAGCTAGSVADETALWQVTANSSGWTTFPTLFYGQKIDFFVISNVNTATDLAAGATLQGVTLVSGMLVGLIGQSTPAQNGVYLVTAGAASRDFTVFGSYLDFCCSGTFGGFIYIANGTYQGRVTQWNWTGSAAAIGSGSQLSAYITATNYQVGVASGVASLSVSGYLPTTQMPGLTGNVTSSDGGVSTTIANNAVTLAKLATQATNTVLANATSGTAVPTALAVGSCDTATKALQWTTNTGFACNSSITANAVPAANLTGSTLASGVTASSLTSLGTITSLTATTLNATTMGGTLTLYAGGATNTRPLTSATAGNNIVFGSSNANYYGALGNISGTGSPFISLNADHSSTASTLRNDSSGRKGCAVVYDGTNLSFQCNSVTTAAADFTGTVTPFSMTPAGSITMNALTTASGTPNSICQNNSTKEIVVNAALTCTVSSLAFKHDWLPMSKPALPAIMAMRPGSFFYNDDASRQRLGFAAEYMADIDPRLGDGFDAGGHPKSIDQNAILAIAIKGLQELNARLERVEAR